MALSSKDKSMLVGLSKNLIKKGADKIKKHIDSVDSSTDPKKVVDSLMECKKAVADIDAELDKLKNLLKPDARTSN